MDFIGQKLGQGALTEFKKNVPNMQLAMPSFGGLSGLLKMDGLSGILNNLKSKKSIPQTLILSLISFLFDVVGKELTKNDEEESPIKKHFLKGIRQQIMDAVQRSKM